MEPDECDPESTVPGDVLEGVDYTVTLRTNGLYFIAVVPGPQTSQRVAPQRTLRYERVYAVWACEGHTAGSLYVDAGTTTLRCTSPMPARKHSNANADPHHKAHYKAHQDDKPTHTPTPTATPRPLPPDLILRAPHREDDQFPFNRVGCKELRPGTPNMT